MEKLDNDDQYRKLYRASIFVSLVKRDLEKGKDSRGEPLGDLENDLSMVQGILDGILSRHRNLNGTIKYTSFTQFSDKDND